MEKNKKLENFISANLRAAVLWLKCCRYGVLKHPLAINQANVVHVTKKKKRNQKSRNSKDKQDRTMIKKYWGNRENNNLTDKHKIGNKIKQNLRHDNYNTMPLNHQQSQPLKWGHKQKRGKKTHNNTQFLWLIGI